MVWGAGCPFSPKMKNPTARPLGFQNFAAKGAGYRRWSRPPWPEGLEAGPTIAPAAALDVLLQWPLGKPRFPPCARVGRSGLIPDAPTSGSFPRLGSRRRNVSSTWAEQIPRRAIGGCRPRSAVETFPGLTPK